jgi:hypothetical protein
MVSLCIYPEPLGPIVRVHRSCGLLAVAVLVFAIACERQAFITVARGSSADHLTFLVSRVAGDTIPLPTFDGLRVFARDCGETGAAEGNIMWLLVSATPVDRVRPPIHILYGVPPNGFSNSRGPAALTPGCFEADIIADGYAAVVRLRVLPDGSVESTTRSS